MATILVAMGILIDTLVILKHTPEWLEFILFADIPIFAGLTLDLYYGLKGRKPKKEEPLVTPVALPSTVEAEDSDSEPNAQTAPRGIPPAIIIERYPQPGAEYNAPLHDVPKRLERTRQKPSFTKSREGLKSPAFLCNCGHPHRFVCLACGMTLEKALEKKGQRWVEWQPDMNDQG